MSTLLLRIDQALTEAPWGPPMPGAPGAPKVTLTAQTAWRKGDVYKEMRRVAVQVEETRYAVKRLSELAVAELTRAQKALRDLPPEARKGPGGQMESFVADVLAKAEEHYVDVQAQLTDIQRNIIIG